MIIVQIPTTLPLSPGQRVTMSITDTHGQRHTDVPVLVLREATREEYLAQRPSDAQPFTPAQQAVLDGPARFFEIATD